jgi:hypothetical protein
MTRHVIEVETFIKRTPEAFYTMLTDHPNLDSFRELSDSVLLREGDKPHWPPNSISVYPCVSLITGG